MRRILILCTFLAFSAISVNAQNCPEPNCPFNGAEMSGQSNIGHFYVSYYMLPQVSSATYSWHTDGFLKHFSGGGNSPGVGYASPNYGGSGGNVVWGYEYTPYPIQYNQNTGLPITATMPGWYFVNGSGAVIGQLYDDVCQVRCYVTCSYGHTHYFSKKILISGP